MRGVVSLRCSKVYPSLVLEGQLPGHGVCSVRAIISAIFWCLRCRGSVFEIESVAWSESLGGVGRSGVSEIGGKNGFLIFFHIFF